MSVRVVENQERTSPAGGEQEAGALADHGGRGRARGPGFAAPFRSADDHLDVVLLVAVELLEGVDPNEPPVGAHELVALPPDPVGDRLVVALAPADERARRGRGGRPAAPSSVASDAREELPQRAGARAA